MYKRQNYTGVWDIEQREQAMFTVRVRYGYGRVPALKYAPFNRLSPYHYVWVTLSAGTAFHRLMLFNVKLNWKYQ